MKRKKKMKKKEKEKRALLIPQAKLHKYSRKKTLQFKNI